MKECEMRQRQIINHVVSYGFRSETAGPRKSGRFPLRVKKASYDDGHSTITSRCEEEQEK